MIIKFNVPNGFLVLQRSTPGCPIPRVGERGVLLPKDHTLSPEAFTVSDVLYDYYDTEVYVRFSED